MKTVTDSSFLIQTDHFCPERDKWLFPHDFNRAAEIESMNKLHSCAIEATNIYKKTLEEMGKMEELYKKTETERQSLSWRYRALHDEIDDHWEEMLLP